MMSQLNNSLAAAILVHNENLLRLCTKVAAVSMAKGCQKDACKRSIEGLHCLLCHGNGSHLGVQVPTGLIDFGLQDGCHYHGKIKQCNPSYQGL